MSGASTTHLLLIPSYNPGPKVYETVALARQRWNPVWIVVDGSTDGTAAGLEALAAKDGGLHVFQRISNQGKGAAVLFGLDQAATQGYTHVLTMDSDGQHPMDAIPAFMAASLQNPDAMILGVPVFDASAPTLRVKGRRVSNWWANLETLGMDGLRKKGQPLVRKAESVSIKTVWIGTPASLAIRAMLPRTVPMGRRLLRVPSGKSSK